MATNMYRSILIAGILVGSTVAGSMAQPEPTYKVIPGPGMPSMESLGLSTRDLYGVESIVTDVQFSKRHGEFFNTCGNSNQCQVADAQACVYYLQKLGNKACTIPSNGSHQVFCTAEGCNISGYIYHGGEGGPSTTSQPCSSVASTAASIVQECNFNGKNMIQGDAALNQSSNYVVDITQG